MGMFDTIHVKTPLSCPTCGAEILTAPDPLAAILAANKHADEEAED